MQNRKTLTYSLLAGWFIVGLAIVLVAAIIIPEDSRSDYFWYKVVWTEMLNFLFWGSTAFYVLVPGTQKDSVTRFGGVAPTISIVTALYAVLSFSVMSIHAFMPESDIVNRVHWILQIILFAMTALTVVFLSISRAAATSGLGFDRTKALPPKELHDLLAVHESALRNSATRNLKRNIKQLRETLIYSLNECASLADLLDYQQIAREIKEFCASIAELASTSESQADRLDALDKSALALKAKVRLISAKQVRR